jgi:hypothetical protein
MDGCLCPGQSLFILNWVHCCRVSIFCCIVVPFTLNGMGTMKCLCFLLRSQSSHLISYQLQFSLMTVINLLMCWIFAFRVSFPANSNFELGRGSNFSDWRPQLVPSLKSIRVIQVACGGYHSSPLTGKLLELHSLIFHELFLDPTWTNRKPLYL